MRLCEILDVDVVAHAGAVAGFIVIAEDGDLIALAERNLKHERNKVAFGVVRFAIFFRCTAGVEVTQENALDSMDLLSPLEYFFTEQLGFAVDRFGFLGQGFVHGHTIRRSVGGAGGGEDQFFAAGRHHGKHQVE